MALSKPDKEARGEAHQPVSHDRQGLFPTVFSWPPGLPGASGSYARLRLGKATVRKEQLLNGGTVVQRGHIERRHYCRAFDNTVESRAGFWVDWNLP